MKTVMKLAMLLIAVAVFEGASAPAAYSQVYVGRRIRVAPPAPRREVVRVAPYRGAVWIPGHHDWRPRRNGYVWVSGRWASAPRAGVVWVPERWAFYNGEYVFYKGYWQ